MKSLDLLALESLDPPLAETGVDGSSGYMVLECVGLFFTADPSCPRALLT